MYSEAMEVNIHPVRVDGVEACGESGGPANREKRVISVPLQVLEVYKAVAGRDCSRLDS